ncbi:MAG: hypothetical protein U0R28_11110 [Candidatus Nanopelagicales bacterium]
MTTQEYGISVLATGFARMWRGVLPFVMVALVNAVVQASLLYLSPFWLALGISAAVLLISFALITQIAVRSVSGRSGLADLVGGDLLRFSLWVIGWTLVVSAGFALYFWPGVLLLALTAFIPVAAVTGARNPLAANFRAIRARPWRWLVTVLITLLVVLVVWLASALTTFFIGGWIAAFGTWLVIGFVAAWLLTAWSALYRSTPAAA